MRKRLTITLLVVCVLLGAVLFGGYNYLVNYQEDQEYSEKTKNQLKDFENLLIQNIENKKSNQSNVENETLEELDDSSLKENNDIEEEQPEPQETKTAVTSDAKKVPEVIGIVTHEEKRIAQASLEEIIETYEITFSELEIEANDLLDSLINEAIKEYNSLTAKEKTNPLIMSKMATNYLGRATKLEEEVDSVFYNFLTKMEEELKAANLDTSIIKQYDEAYIKEKKIEDEKY